MLYYKFLNYVIYEFQLEWFLYTYQVYELFTLSFPFSYKLIQ